MGRPFEDCAEVAVKRGVDFAAFGAGRERDPLDEGADRLGRLVALLRALKRLGKPLHLAAVDAGDVRMNVRDIDGARERRSVNSSCFASSSRRRSMRGGYSRRPRWQ